MNLICQRQQAAQLLYYVAVVRTTAHKRSSDDRRVFVDETVVAYRGHDGAEYRKAFETRPGVTPVIPTRGTHRQLNDARKQW